MYRIGFLEVDVPLMPVVSPHERTVRKMLASDGALVGYGSRFIELEPIVFVRTLIEMKGRSSVSEGIGEVLGPANGHASPRTARQLVRSLPGESRVS